jgi:hypothetical protein
MKNHSFCFGCDGNFDADDDIASSRRSSYDTLSFDSDIDPYDLAAINAFFDLNKKAYSTPICWDCALFRVLGYIDKYDDKRNG